MKKEKKQPSGSTDKGDRDGSFYPKVFECLADLQLRDGVPLHPPSMRRALWDGKRLKKGQAKYFISRLIARGWIIPDRGRGLYLNESMLADYEDRIRLEAQSKQVSASVREWMNDGITYRLNENWQRADQQGNAG